MLSIRRLLWQRRAALVLVAVLALLALIYLPTLLTQVTGDGDSYLNDVGEFQVALNVWGTVHATGYPLFLMIGNMVVAALRAVGVAPVTAPSLYALLWGLSALGVFYALVLRLTGRIEIAAVTTLHERAPRRAGQGRVGVSGVSSPNPRPRAILRGPR